MPTTPTPFTGAPTTDATAVPCTPPSGAGSWLFNAMRFGRPTNSGCPNETPESTMVTGTPGPGGVSVSTWTSARHHSVGTSGSVASSRARGAAASIVTAPAGGAAMTTAQGRRTARSAARGIT